MKKFLYGLCFALLSPLLSAQIFKEELHGSIIALVLANNFSKNPELKTIGNLRFLKYVAENYLEPFIHKDIDHHISSGSGKPFGIDKRQESDVIKNFIDIAGGWKGNFRTILHRVFLQADASDDFRALAEPLNSAYVDNIITLFKSKPAENVVWFLTNEELEAFSKAFIKICDKEILLEYQRVRNKIMRGMVGIVGAAAILGISSMLNNTEEIVSAEVASNVVVETVVAVNPLNNINFRDAIISAVVGAVGGAIQGSFGGPIGTLGGSVIGAAGGAVGSVIGDSVGGTTGGVITGVTWGALAGGPAGAVVGALGGAVEGSMRDL